MNTPTQYTYKEIGLIAYPILISLLMEQLIGMTDTAFMGRVGEVELGASALAGIYYLIIFMMGFGFSIGAQILIGRRNGEKNYRQIGGIFYQGILFLSFLAVCMIAFSLLFSPHILRHIIQSEDIYQATLSYINWRVYGFLFSFAGTMFRAFFVGTTQTKTLTLNSVVMVLSNILFNYILIFGKCGFPAMGIAGAAVGSCLAELMSLLFFILYTYRHIDYRKYGLHRFHGFQKDILKRIFQVSFWTMIQNGISMSTWFLFFIAVEHLGERPLAITNIIRNVSAIPFMTTAAFASTCSTLVSNLIGAGKTKYVKGTIRQVVWITYGAVFPITILFLLFPEQTLHIYTDSTELIQSAIPALWVLCTTYIPQVPGQIYFQAVSGTGNTRMAFQLEIATLCIYVAYVIYTVLYLKIDVALCWTTEHVYGTFIFLFSWLYIKRGNWRNKTI